MLIEIFAIFVVLSFHRAEVLPVKGIFYAPKYSGAVPPCESCNGFVSRPVDRLSNGKGSTVFCCRNLNFIKMLKDSTKKVNAEHVRHWNEETRSELSKLASDNDKIINRCAKMSKRNEHLKSLLKNDLVIHNTKLKKDGSIGLILKKGGE